MIQFDAADAKVVLVYAGLSENLNDKAKEFSKAKTLDEIAGWRSEQAVPYRTSLGSDGRDA
jgi:hypothetical protein